MEFGSHAARVLDTATARGADYCDVRFERTRSERAEVRNGDVSGLADERSDGYGIRALVDGAWGLLRATGSTDAALDAAAARAVDAARAGAAIAAHPDRRRTDGALYRYIRDTRRTRPAHRFRWASASRSCLMPNPYCMPRRR